MRISRCLVGLTGAIEGCPISIPFQHEIVTLISFLAATINSVLSSFSVDMDRIKKIIINGRMSLSIIGLIEKVETAFLLTLNIIKGRSRTQSAESNRQISLQSIDSSFIMFDTRVMSKVKMIVGHCRPLSAALY